MKSGIREPPHHGGEVRKEIHKQKAGSARRNVPSISLLLQVAAVPPSSMAPSLPTKIEEEVLALLPMLMLLAIVRMRRQPTASAKKKERKKVGKEDICRTRKEEFELVGKHFMKTNKKKQHISNVPVLFAKVTMPSIPTC